GRYVRQSVQDCIAAHGPAQMRRFSSARGRVARSRRLCPKQSQARKAKVQLAAGPGVRCGVGDLRGGELRRGPVRGLGAFGDAESEEHAGEVAYSGLAEPRAARDEPEVEAVLLLEGEPCVQRAQVVRPGVA